MGSGKEAWICTPCLWRSSQEQGLEHYSWSGQCKICGGGSLFLSQHVNNLSFHCKGINFSVFLVLWVIISVILWAILSCWYSCVYQLCLGFFLPPGGLLVTQCLCHFVVPPACWYRYIFLEWSHHEKELECFSSFPCTCQASKSHACWLVFIRQV